MWDNIIMLCFVTNTISQQLDSPCTLESTGSSGICKLISDCIIVRDEVINRQQLPQICGVQETQPIVCCPKDLSEKRKPGSISKIKCKQYSSYTQSQCDGHKIVKRIVGGEIASRKEFPHMVAIGIGSNLKNVKWSCGGILISDLYVLTVAHCIHNKEEVKYVQIGITNLKDTEHRQQFKIAEIILHPNYTASLHYHDIGLLKLENKVDLNSYARPACLNTHSDISFKQAIATGWGATSSDDSVVDQLHKVILDAVDYESCSKNYPKSYRKLKFGILKESQFCFGLGLEEKDTCKGDGGGPLQTYHSDDEVTCMYDIIGLISFAKGCVGGAGVYTKLSYYVEWIEDIVWPEPK